MRRLLIPVLVTMSVVPAAAADRPRTAVPLSIDGKGGVVVEVQVNDAGPFRFLIDTGAARSVVADDLAAALGAPAVAKSDVVAMSIVAPRVGIQVARRLTPGVNTGIIRPLASTAGLPASSL